MKKVITILNIVIFIAFFVLTSLCLKYLAIHNDQITNCLQPFFSFTDHGNYLISHINRLVTFTIPRHLGYNIIDWQSDVVKYFRAFVLISIAFCFSNCAFINSKKNILQPILFVICYLYIITALMFSDGWQLECACGFGRFIIVNLFLVLFWYNFARFYIEPKKINKKDLVFISISALLLGNMSEILALSSVIALILLLVYNFYSQRCVQSNCSEQIQGVEQKINSFNNTKHLIVCSLLFLTIGGLLMLFSKEYFLDNIESHSGKITFDTLINSFALYKDFFAEYYKNIILKHWMIWALLLVCSPLVFILKEEKSKRIALISICLTLGVLACFMLFIFAKGEVNDMDSIQLYESFNLAHHDFPIIIRLELLMVVMFLLSTVLKLFQDNKIAVSTAAILLILGCFCNIMIGEYERKISDFLDKTYCYKKDMYLNDKIFIESYKRNNKKINLFLSEYNENYPNICVKNYQNYFEKVYGIDVKSEDIIWTDKETAINNYAANGGSFSYSELKELKFAKLYDIKDLKNKEIKFYPIFYWQKDEG